MKHGGSIAFAPLGGPDRVADITGVLRHPLAHGPMKLQDADDFSVIFPHSEKMMGVALQISITLHSVQPFTGAFYPAQRAAAAFGTETQKFPAIIFNFFQIIRCRLD